MSKNVLAWHFVGRTLRDGRPVPADGEVLRHEGRIEMCHSGLHGSVRILDALRYAPGTTLCRVEMRDVVAEEEDKLVACERVILWRVNAADVIGEFARDCALEVLHLWAHEGDRDIDEVIEFLLTGDRTLDRGALAAHYSVVGQGYKARSAATAAGWAADYVAYAAPYCAAHAASNAALAAEGSIWKVRAAQEDELYRRVVRGRGRNEQGI